MTGYLKQFVNLIKSGLFQRTFVYTMSTAINAGVAFLLLPILTRYLTPYDYGIVEMYLVISLLLAAVLPMGGDVLLSKEYFSLGSPARERYMGNVVGMIYLNGAIIFIMVFVVGIFSDILPRILKIENTVIMLAIFGGIASTITSLVTTIFQLEKKAKQFAIFVNSRSFADLTLSLMLVLVMGLKWQGRIAGILTSTVLFMLLAFIVFKKRSIRNTFPKEYGRQMVIMGAPIVIALVTGSALEAVSKLIISNATGLESTGLYSVALRFGMIVMVLEAAFSRAWLPFFFEKINANSINARLQIVRVTYIYIIILTMFSLLYGYYAKYLLYFVVDKRYHAAGQFILLISLAYCFDGIWKMFIGYLINAGKTRIYSAIVALVAVGNAGATYFFLNRFGLIGVAWAMLVSFAFGTILTIVFATRCNRMPWFSRSLVGINRP
jgi:O-antigen/teichoic acid export membrane protein